MITRIEYKNFKNLKNLSCDLSRLTVVVGPNASGKTSMLQGLQFRSRVNWSSPSDIKTIFSGGNRLDFLHTTDGKEPMVIACDTEAGRQEFIAVRFERELPLLPDSSEVYGSISPFALNYSDSSTSTDAWTGLVCSPSRDAVSDEIEDVAFLQFEPKAMSRPSYCEDVRPEVTSTGEGLGAVLASLALSSPDVFELIQSRLRQIVPEFQRLRFKRVKINRDESEIIRIGDEAITRKISREYPADMLIFDFSQRLDIPATNVSEGTILALGLLTILHSSRQPRVILLDDIEKGLHPNAQRELIGMLRDILRDQPDLQIVATSHSPYFLDFLDPSEVRLMAIGPDGFSRCGMLTDHPEFEKWKDEMTPGEMWSFFGEKWLVEEKV